MIKSWELELGAALCARLGFAGWAASGKMTAGSCELEAGSWLEELGTGGGLGFQQVLRPAHYVIRYCRDTWNPRLPPPSYVPECGFIQIHGGGPQHQNVRPIRS